MGLISQKDVSSVSVSEVTGQLARIQSQADGDAAAARRAGDSAGAAHDAADHCGRGVGPAEEGDEHRLPWPRRGDHDLHAVRGVHGVLRPLPRLLRGADGCRCIVPARHARPVAQAH